jgi:hypothetical protein
MSKSALKRLGDDWHADRDNVLLLITWAEGEGYSASEIVRIVEKPWKYRAEFIVAYCRSVDA